jgi:hypothetical protein
MRRTAIKLLALYVDFIVISTFVALTSFGLGLVFDYVAGTGKPWYVELGLSVVLTGMARALGLSMGEPLLAYAASEAESGSPQRLWPNLVLGSFLILDGLKTMLRWSQLDVAIPVFGLVETTPAKVAVLLAMGAVSVAAGAMILAFVRNAKLAAAGSLVLSTISLAISWPVLGDAVARVQAARREVQGLAVREGEVEAMQVMLPVIFVVLLIAILILLLLSREQRT